MEVIPNVEKLIKPSEESKINWELEQHFWWIKNTDVIYKIAEKLDFYTNQKVSSQSKCKQNVATFTLLCIDRRSDRAERPLRARWNCDVPEHYWFFLKWI